jgi:hypothetical protein
MAAGAAAARLHMIRVSADSHYQYFGRQSRETLSIVGLAKPSQSIKDSHYIMGGTKLPTRKIDEMVWRALTDVSFRKQLLQDRRLEILEGFGLTNEEQEAVMAVTADTLEGFAGALCQPAL